MGWNHLQNIGSRCYRCGFCGREVASRDGLAGVCKLRGNGPDVHCHIYVCPQCSNPSSFAMGVQTPGVSFGSVVTGVPPLLSSLYEEARACCSIGSYTAAVLLCRKILMNLGVQEGAEEGKSFLYYVEYLSTNNFIPPRGKPWVDYIRTKGNEANHEIALMSQQDGERLVLFSEMLLKFIYEFPSHIPAAPAQAPSVGLTIPTASP